MRGLRSPPIPPPLAKPLIMPCTNPLQAWKYGTHPSGKQKLVFKDPECESAEVQWVPCGKCEDCRIAYSRDWATRVFHELQINPLGCFLTLTINNASMVTKGFNHDGKYYPPYSVYKRSLQLFLKRLRKEISYVQDNKRVYQNFKYLGCGEYGESYHRPHYHLVLMGYDFPDKKLWQVGNNGNPLYRSSILEKCWPYGHSTIGEASWQSAAYIARYTLKKRKGPGSYTRINKETGEMYEVRPEFVLMSKGIGKDWWKKYKSDTDKDYIIVDRDKTVRIPRYYDKLRERHDPESLEEIKLQREIAAKEYQEEDDDSRKLARATVKKAQVKMLKRGIENV